MTLFCKEEPPHILFSIIQDFEKPPHLSTEIFPPIPKLPWKRRAYRVGPSRPVHARLTTSAWWLLTWNRHFHLRLRSRCRRSRWCSGLPCLAGPDTASCPSLLERCQSWWDRLREDEKALSWVDSQAPPTPCLHRSVYEKMCVSQCCQCVFRFLTCVWPAEQTFTLWARRLTGGDVRSSFTCSVEGGRWGRGCAHDCCDLWQESECTVGVLWRPLQPIPADRLSHPPPSGLFLKANGGPEEPRLISTPANQELDSLTHPLHASIQTNSREKHLGLQQPIPPPSADGAKPQMVTWNR